VPEPLYVQLMSATIEERYSAELAAQMLEHGHLGGGALPQYLGLELVRFAPGKLWCRAIIREELVTPFGTVHGGVAAAIIDHVTGVVMYPLMPRGHWAATTEIKTNYVAPLKPGVVETESTVLAMTNRSAVVRGEIYGEGKLLCAAQGTLTIVAPRPG
jgi:1,4-dihydroxy-2-naphthoyl-CoA hydrolase